MGAQLEMFYPRGATPEDIIEEFHREQEALTEEFGNDTYGGHLGIVPGLEIEDRIFTSRQDAEHYVEENAQKWEAAIAAAYITKGQIPTAAGKKKRAKHVEAIKKADDFPGDVLRSIKTAKSKTIGCKKCGSSLSRAWLKDINCPLCSASLLSETGKMRQTRLRVKARDIGEAAIPMKTGDRKYYVIGGCCAC